MGRDIYCSYKIYYDHNQSLSHIPVYIQYMDLQSIPVNKYKSQRHFVLYKLHLLRKGMGYMAFLVLQLELKL